MHCWASQQWHPTGKTKTTALRGTDARLSTSVAPLTPALSPLRGAREKSRRDRGRIRRLGGVDLEARTARPQPPACNVTRTLPASGTRGVMRRRVSIRDLPQWVQLIPQNLDELGR